jgi:hypothetical protein
VDGLQISKLHCSVDPFQRFVQCNIQPLRNTLAEPIMKLSTLEFFIVICGEAPLANSVKSFNLIKIQNVKARDFVKFNSLFPLPNLLMNYVQGDSSENYFKKFVCVKRSILFKFVLHHFFVRRTYMYEKVKRLTLTYITNLCIVR